MGKTPLTMRDGPEEKTVPAFRPPAPKDADKNVFLITPKEELQEARRFLREARNDTERLDALAQISSVYAKYMESSPYPFTHEDTRLALEDMYNYSLKPGFSEDVRKAAMSHISSKVLLFSCGTTGAALPDDLAIFLPDMVSIAQSSSNSAEFRSSALFAMRNIASLPGDFALGDANFNTMLSCTENILGQASLGEQLLSKCAELAYALAMQSLGGETPVLPDVPRTNRLLWCINRLISLAPDSEPIYDAAASAFIRLSSAFLSAGNYSQINPAAVQQLLSKSYSIANNDAILSFNPLRIQAGSVLLAAAFLSPASINMVPSNIFQLDPWLVGAIRNGMPPASQSVLYNTDWASHFWKMAVVTYENRNKRAIGTLFENYNTVQFGDYDFFVLNNMLNNLHTKTGKPILFAIVTRKPDGVSFASLLNAGDLANFDIRMIEAKDEDEALAYMKKVAGNLGIRKFSEDSDGEKFSVFGIHGHGMPWGIGLGVRPETGGTEKYFLDLTDKDLAQEIGEYFTWKKPGGQLFHGAGYFFACAPAGNTGTLLNNVAETWAENAGMKLFGAQLATQGFPALEYGIENGTMTVSNVKYDVNRNSYDFRNPSNMAGRLDVSQDGLQVKVGFGFPEVPPSAGYLLEGYDIERSEDEGKTFERVGFLQPGQNSFIDGGASLGSHVYKIKQRWYKNVGHDGPGTYSDSRDYQFAFSQNKQVEVKGIPVPSSLTLYQNYPNPFNITTNIHYYLPKAGKVSLKLYDVAGREVSNLVSADQKVGDHYEVFNASSLASGTYFCRLVVEGKTSTSTETKKMVLVK